MGTLEEIRKMQREGKSEDEMIDFLQGQGISIDEIQESLAQAKIKQAVSDQRGFSESEEGQEQTMTRLDNPGQGMEPSLLEASTDNSQPPALPPEQSQAEQQPQSYMPEQNSNAYESYSSQMSADTISEIADQVVAERISSLRSKIESALDTRALMDSKLESLDERLKRVEKIIDRLQLSVLQKVGDYITNVEDIKKELSETQKSFKSMISQKMPREDN